MMFYIFAIVPFGLSYKQKGWHLVLFNNWFKINDLHKHWQTSFTYLPEEKMFCFTRFWGKPNKFDEDYKDTEMMYQKSYFQKFIYAPWFKCITKIEYLSNGKWVEDYSNRDKYKTTFKFFENEKRIVVKAVLLAERQYFGIWWLPHWLNCFNKKNTFVYIHFSTDIGKDRGTYKGGTTMLVYPFKRTLKDTWTDFEYNELPLYLNKVK